MEQEQEQMLAKKKRRGSVCVCVCVSKGCMEGYGGVWRVWLYVRYLGRTHPLHAVQSRAGPDIIGHICAAPFLP